MKKIKICKVSFFVLILFCFSSLYSEPRLETVSSYGKLYTVTSHVAYPQCIEDLELLVKEAHLKGQKISIIGAGMSQGKQSLLENSLLIDMSNINDMKLNGKTLTVGAGAFWDDIQAFINSHGLALQTMQGSNIFSIGGSISANCHGWDFRTGTIANTVKELTIINSKGEIMILSPSHPLFYYVIGGYGCFGIITEAKILLTDNLPIAEVSEEIPLDKYIEYFHKKVESSPDALMHRYRLSVHSKDFLQSGVATNYIKSGNERIISNLRGDSSKEKLLRRSLWFIRKFPNTKDYIFKLAKKRVLKTAVSTRNEVMSPPVQFHFTEQKNSADWLQEFFIAEEEFEDFIGFLKETLQKNNVLLLNATVRYVKKEPVNSLSYTRDKNQFAIVLYFVQKLSKEEIELTRTWVQNIINYLIDHQGTYYLPYQHFAIPAQFRASYSKWENFKMMKEQYDPDMLFFNGFYKDYFQSL